MRWFVPIGSIALVSLSSACAATLPEPPRPSVSDAVCDGDRLTLRFDWPESFVARVRGVDVTESQNHDGTRPLRGMTFSELEMVVEPAGDGRLVHFDVLGMTRPRTQGFAPEASGVRPAVLLSPIGEVTEVRGADRMREALLLDAREGRVPDEALPRTMPNLTDSVQLHNARSHWHWILGVWNGQELTCGRPLRGPSTVPAMVLGVPEVRAHAELVYEGRVSCPGEPLDRGATCVRLRVRQRADDQALVGALRSVARLTGDDEVLGGVLVRDVEVVAERDTLVLHEVAFVDHAAIERRPRGRARWARWVVDRQTYRFRYGDEPEPESPVPSLASH